MDRRIDEDSCEAGAYKSKVVKTPVKSKPRMNTRSTARRGAELFKENQDLLDD